MEISETQRAFHYSSNWYEAISSKDTTLLRALIHVRGPSQLSRHVAILHHAISDGNREIVQLFLDNGCNANMSDTVYSKITPLMEAIRKGDLDICDLLLQKQYVADNELVDGSGENIMHWAARYTNGTFIKGLLGLCEAHGFPKDMLVKLLIAPNRKKATPLSLAKSSMTQRYIQQYLSLA